MSQHVDARWKALGRHLGQGAGILVSYRVDEKMFAVSRGRINVRFLAHVTEEELPALATQLGFIQREEIPEVAVTWTVDAQLVDARFRAGQASGRPVCRARWKPNLKKPPSRSRKR